MKISKKAVCLILMMIFCSGCAGKETEKQQNDAISDVEQADSNEMIPIKIGAILESTGSGAAWGRPRADAIQIAVKQIEDAGGFKVSGKKYYFVLDSSDNRSKPDEAVTIAKRLLDTEKVSILFDAGNSNTSLPVCEYVKGREHLHFTLSTTAQNYIGEPGYENYFNCWKPDFGADGIAENLAKQIANTLPEAKTAAFLFMNDSQGKMLVPFYKDALKAHGIETIAEEYYASGTIDYNAQLGQIYEKEPDILFMGINDEEVKSMLKQALQIGFKNFATCRVQPSIADERLEELGDGYFFGIVDRDFTDPEELKGEGIEQYLKDYKELFKNDPDYKILNRAVATYEPIFALVQAMQEAESVEDIPAITAALKGMRYEGRVWTIKFDEEGQMTNDYYVYCAHNNEITKEHIIP